MQIMQSLEKGKFYHIYHRGINSGILFKETSNYEHFLKLHDIHIEPMAKTHAWCLMKNHFHFLTGVKMVEEITTENKIQPSQSFFNLFNAYTKAFNKKCNRHGALFERPFRRKSIENDNYFKNLFAYIHNNPVHHNICEHPITFLSDKPTKLKRKGVIEIFEDSENFKYIHQLKSHDLSIDSFF